MIKTTYTTEYDQNGKIKTVKQTTEKTPNIAPPSSWCDMAINFSADKDYHGK